MTISNQRAFLKDLYNEENLTFNHDHTIPQAANRYLDSIKYEPERHYLYRLMFQYMGLI